MRPHSLDELVAGFIDRERKGLPSDQQDIALHLCGLNLRGRDAEPRGLRTDCGDECLTCFRSVTFECGRVQEKFEVGRVKFERGKVWKFDGRSLKFEGGMGTSHLELHTSNFI